MDKTFVIVDESKGIYQGQWLATLYKTQIGWAGADRLDIEALLSGPEHPYYWDALDYVCDKAIWTDPDGVEYKIWRDGDIFLYSGNGDQWL